MQSYTKNSYHANFIVKYLHVPKVLLNFVAYNIPHYYNNATFTMNLRPKYFLIALLLAVTSSVIAANRDAVYIWITSNNYVCYKLESKPQITYSNGNVNLTIPGRSKPELTLPIPAKSRIKMVFGIYGDPQDINIPKNQSDTIKQNGKYITGGKLIIVKKGKQYTPSGKRIK